MLNVAVEAAKANNVVKLPKLAALLVHKKHGIVAIGYNSYKTHPLQVRFQADIHKIHRHAEIDALQKALRCYTEKEVSEMQMYIARISKNGLPANSKPCSGCQEALEFYGITKVTHT